MIKISSFNANGLRDRNRRQQTVMVCEAEIMFTRDTLGYGGYEGGSERMDEGDVCE